MKISCVSGGCAALSLLLAGGIGWVLWLVDDDFRTYRSYEEYRVPAGKGRVLVVDKMIGLSDGETVCFLVDPALFGGKPFKMRYQPDDRLSYTRWSRDGSVVAFEKGIMDASEEQLLDVLYVFAYDFRRHRSLGTARSLHARSREITRLLRQRGGVGVLMGEDTTPHAKRRWNEPIPHDITTQEQELWEQAENRF